MNTITITRTLLQSTVVLLLVTSPAFPEKPLRDTARDAVSGNGLVRASAIERLRAAGPSGLEAALNAANPTLERGPSDPGWRAAADAIDQIAAQRDAWASGLYWYTDLEKAKAAARREGKPILSLRLLGRLDQELSCANSRFFRTVYYANAEIGQRLRDRFVLHWQSVRPVPVVTVDFGDGRTIQRTVTGNSIHWVLDPDGNPVDALPGLYGPAAFLRELSTAEKTMHRAVAAPSEEERKKVVREALTRHAADIRVAWVQDLARLGIPTKPESDEIDLLGRRGFVPIPTPEPASFYGPRPSARYSAPIATSKMAAERPLIEVLLPGTSPTTLPGESPIWAAVASLHWEDAVLDAGSRALMRHKCEPQGDVKPDFTATFDYQLWDFQSAIASDQIRNEYRLRPTILEWIAAGTGDLEGLTARVYAELFLTPDGDPWLGLSSSPYSAIDGGGFRVGGSGPLARGR